MLEAETTVSEVQETPPTVAVAPVKNPVPVIVTGVPPAVLPDVGETEVTVGAGAGELTMTPKNAVPFFVILEVEFSVTVIFVLPDAPSVLPESVSAPEIAEAYAPQVVPLVFVITKVSPGAP